MKLIPTVDAAGQVLCHDITQIIPGEFKGARFRKGHIIQPEDIPVLLSIGKENLYVWEKKPGILHEDEAAALLAASWPFHSESIFCALAISGSSPSSISIAAGTSFEANGLRSPPRTADMSAAVSSLPSPTASLMRLVMRLARSQ